MKIFWTLEPPQRRNLLVLFAAGLLFWSSLASLLPTLPSYVQDIGGTDQQVGIVMGAFAIGLLLFRPKLGRIADTRSRKAVLLLGTIVAAIAPLGYLLVQEISLLAAIRAFHGISIAAFTTAYSALVVDLSPLRQRGELIGYMSLVQPIGVALGPAIGGLLQAQAGYSPLFCLATGLAIISLLGASWIQEANRETGTQEDREKLSPHSTLREAASASTPLTPHPSPLTPHSSPTPSNAFWHILRRPSLRVPSLVLLLIGVAFGSLSTFVPLYITETKVNLNAGWFYTAAAIASFSIRLFIGRASDRYGRGLFLTGSIFSYCLAMLMLSQANSAPIFLLAGALEGAGSGTLFPMMIALISDRSLPQERGQVFAICISGFDLGMAIAGPVLGSFAAQISYRGIFAISTGLSCLALLIFITRCSKDLSHSLKFALGRTDDIYALQPVRSHP